MNVIPLIFLPVNSIAASPTANIKVELSTNIASVSIVDSLRMAISTSYQLNSMSCVSNSLVSEINNSPCASHKFDRLINTNGCPCSKQVDH
jgi:hypothetical protein